MGVRLCDVQRLAPGVQAVPKRAGSACIAPPPSWLPTTSNRLRQVLEWGTMLAYGKGWVSLWNGLDAATYLLQARRAAQGRLLAGRAATAMAAVVV